jgi:hypothetical protein
MLYLFSTDYVNDKTQRETDVDKAVYYGPMDTSSRTPVWHDTSLLKSAFKDVLSEVDPKLQNLIAASLAKDYKNAVKEITGGAFDKVEKELRNVVQVSNENIAMWTSPSGFRIRNYYPGKQYVKWSIEHRGPWGGYWGTRKTATLQPIGELFPSLERFWGPTGLDQILRSLYFPRCNDCRNKEVPRCDQCKNPDGSKLYDILIKVGVPSKDRAQYIKKPYQKCKQNDDIYRKLIQLLEGNDPETGGESDSLKNQYRKPLLCRIISLFEDGFYSDKLVSGGLFTGEFEELETIFNDIRRRAIIKISFSPPRLEANLTSKNDNDKIKKSLRDMKSGITPNFIHSIDAAHMTKVINAMYGEYEIKDFSAIHDCFGVHPCDTDQLIEVVKEQFIQVHKGRPLFDWLREFYDPLPVAALEAMAKSAGISPLPKTKADLLSALSELAKKANESPFEIGGSDCEVRNSRFIIS